MTVAMILHGGAGQVPETGRDAVQRGCLTALQTGWSVLRSGSSALDAVCATVAVLEDDPVFNAGVGSVLTRDGTVEMDASVMEGHNRRAGSVALVRTVPNPVRLARAVLEDGQHVLLAGVGAERFAKERGIPTCQPDALITAAQRARWTEQRHPTGTVGAVAVDRDGHVAAATSTGGRFGKRAGRIGDSAIIGAGTYADEVGAASATGNGDAILRVALAYRVVAGLQGGATPQVIAAESVAVLGRVTGATGGIIVLDVLGRIGFAHNTPHMSVAWINTACDGPVVQA